MRSLYFGLDGQPIGVVEAERLLTSQTARCVARTMITTERGRCSVSTVHLVIDHGWGTGAPVLWETMTFGGPDDEGQRRYQSLDDAVAGHEEAVTFCRTALDIEGVRIIAEERIYGPASAKQIGAPVEGTPPPVRRQSQP